MQKYMPMVLFLFLLVLLFSFAAPPSFAASIRGCAVAGSGGSCAAVDTAIGRIDTNVSSLVRTLFSTLLGVAGGVAVLLIIASGYQMIISRGNPEKVKEARERLTAAIVGLLFIIFSTTILQIVGVDILKLPGFSR